MAVLRAVWDAFAESSVGPTRAFLHVGKRVCGCGSGDKRRFFVSTLLT